MIFMNKGTLQAAIDKGVRIAMKEDLATAAHHQFRSQSDWFMEQLEIRITSNIGQIAKQEAKHEVDRCRSDEQFLLDIVSRINKLQLAP